MMRILLLAIFACVCSSSSLWAGEHLKNLQFERVVDGDTFYALGKDISLWGIDAPEEGHILHFTATLYLETLLQAGPIECKPKDHSLYQCFVNGKDIAQDLVRFGLAEDDDATSKGHYALPEAEARRSRVGLWKNYTSEEL
jgi:endonuclease YncB( thermonuclease family)